MSTPPLGWIKPADRTPDQEQAHDAAQASLVRQFSLPVPQLAKGDKIVLTDAWTNPLVIADVGRRFIRELQWTGSCVKVGGTNALRVTIATQRLVSANPIKAFEPFCWHNYAMSRHAIGDDSQGEGSLGSTFYESLTKDGDRDWPQNATDELPDYTIDGDHISIPKQQELVWSSYRNPALKTVLAESKKHLMGGAGECKTPEQVKAMVLNGYGVSFACNNYIGNASVQGSGADACVVGYWNGSGGHQQWVFGYWEHPNLGPLYAVGNNWADDTYPKDPAGLPLCCCWVTEAKVQAALRLDAEVYGLSHQDWFPAQPVFETWADILTRG